MTEGPELAPLGHPAEAEVPQHRGEPGRTDPSGVVALEDATAYELAVEDGRSLPPDHAPRGGAGGAAGPEFREPGA